MKRMSGIYSLYDRVEILLPLIVYLMSGVNHCMCLFVYGLAL